MPPMYRMPVAVYVSHPMHFLLVRSLYVCHGFAHFSELKLHEV